MSQDIAPRLAKMPSEFATRILQAAVSTQVSGTASVPFRDSRGNEGGQTFANLYSCASTGDTHARAIKGLIRGTYVLNEAASSVVLRRFTGSLAARSPFDCPTFPGWPSI